ncbi:hypothetical protein FKM82_010430 [Ascaphus truei]
MVVQTFRLHNCKLCGSRDTFPSLWISYVEFTFSFFLLSPSTFINPYRGKTWLQPQTIDHVLQDVTFSITTAP